MSKNELITSLATSEVDKHTKCEGKHFFSSCRYLHVSILRYIIEWFDYKNCIEYNFVNFLMTQSVFTQKFLFGAIVFYPKTTVVTQQFKNVHNWRTSKIFF